MRYHNSYYSNGLLPNIKLFWFLFLKQSTQEKPYLIIMDFNLDDPLKDLLSDNASEDSFSNFVATKKPPDKSKVDNLFGIANNQKSEPKDANISNPTPKPSVVETFSPIIKKTPPPPKTVDAPKSINPIAEPRKPTTSKKEITFDDTDDLFADLGFDPKKPKASGKQSNILEDLLGETKSKSVPSSRPTTSSSQPVPANRHQSTFSENQEKMSNDIPKPASSGYTPSVSRPRTAISSKRNSNTENKLSDPLGFFGAAQTLTKDEVRSDNNSSSLKNSSTLDWLGLGSNANEKPDQETVHANTDTFAQSHSMQPTTYTAQQASFQPAISTVPLSNIFKPNIEQTAQILANVNAESGASQQHLQQQETQLQVATQMRQQELALVDLQRRQHEMLQQQELHFNTLLQKQLQRQGVLDDNIRQQQERINSHLSMLMMAQPTAPHPFEPNDPINHNNGLNDLLVTAKDVPSSCSETFVELKVENKRLQMENLRLSDMVEHAKENHEKELDLLDTSHRKQMQCVEENLNKLEARLRQENTNLEEFYGKKLDDLIGDRIQLQNEYEEKIKHLMREHSVVLEQLKACHSEEIGQIRGDHMEMIKHLR